MTERLPADARCEQLDDVKGGLDPTDEQITAFKAAWHKANAAGLEGERVRMGLQAALADVVVIPRDAIPRGAASVCVNEGFHCRWSGRSEEAEQWAALADLLSGGSPAAPEDGAS